MNAIKSWTLLEPKPDVILIGKDKCTKEMARRAGCRYARKVETSERGTPQVGSLFTKARKLAKYTILCYTNCDIVLLQDFMGAIEKVAAKFPRFLMVGRRWNLLSSAELPIGSDLHWREEALRIARRFGQRKIIEHGGSDYFVYTKGVFDVALPLMYVGRRRWDRFLIGNVLLRGIPVIDTTELMAIHLWHEEWDRPAAEVKSNVKILESRLCKTIHDAPWVLKDGKVKRR